MTKENLCPLGEAGSREIPKHNIASNPNKDCPACQPVPTNELTADMARVLIDILNCNVMTCVACKDAINEVGADNLMRTLKRIAEAK